MKCYQAIASLLMAVENCCDFGNIEWCEKHEETLATIMKTAPSGGGIDSGTRLVIGSDGDKLIFEAPFHHMNEAGFYDGWTHHIVTVKPSLVFGFDISISGPNRNDIKGYLNDVFHDWLDQEISVDTLSAEA